MEDKKIPLNPPSYAGADVYHSPDVYVNQVPVALWQIPQSNNVSTDQLAEKMFLGCEINSANTAQSGAAAAEYNAQLVRDGVITQEALDAAKNVTTGLGAVDGTFAANVPSFGNDTGGVENAGSYPGTLQLSRNFTLGQMTLAPFVVFPHPVRDFNGITAGQIVANLKLLAINVLDLTRDKYPNMIITNSFRDNDAIKSRTPQNQHWQGQAADLQFKNVSPREYFNIAQWMKNNLPFDQLLLEYQTTGTRTPWIHISYAKNSTRPNNSASKIMTFVNHKTYSTGLVDLSMNFT